MECFIADGGKTGRGGDAIKGSCKILRPELPVVLSLGGRITVQLWGGGYVYLVYEFNVHIQTSGAIYVCVHVCWVSGRKPR